MATLAKGLTGLSALAFVLAVVTNFLGYGFLTSSEGFSFACANLALLAIATTLIFGPQPQR